MKSPSKIIWDMVNEAGYQWSDPCGANHCECDQNAILITSILKYLDNTVQNENSSDNINSLNHPLGVQDL